MKIFTLLSLLLLIACNQESTTEKENTESTVPTVEKKLDAEIKEIKNTESLKKDLEKVKSKIEAKKVVDKTDEIEAPVHKKELIRKGWKLQSAKCQFCNGTGYGWS